ncbi:DUF1488 domain-containing protein [Rhizobium sp. XQZ8]|uniref:DUF1488 domain-containing protein n=1 Tax=Rhizobium populisoli TaxID=2859785 RepID=UPI001C671EC3|nr:DUF1488 domain-containing protein [Rhizobium populisoli]MBW6425973.1 DUF1488 domain-containing protein [Rhizobium populisoli]
MALQFPNRSRSFDDVKHTVRFHGYDGMFEVRFIVEAAVLMKMPDRGFVEADCLDAFDRLRPTIEDVAAKAYKRNRRSSFTLTVDDFT